MTKTFKFNDIAKCPVCDKALDMDVPARDFIVFDKVGNPTSQRTEDCCGWCDTNFVAYVTAPGTIVFKSEDPYENDGVHGKDANK